MDIQPQLRYSKDHEWVLVEEGRATVGITDYAQDALGDVVFVQLPEVGRVVSVGDVICEVESTKSVSEVYAPLSGTVQEVNLILADKPETINDSPYDAGWLCILAVGEIGDGVDALLSADDYRALTEG